MRNTCTFLDRKYKLKNGLFSHALMLVVKVPMDLTPPEAAGHSTRGTVSISFLRDLRPLKPV